MLPGLAIAAHPGANHEITIAGQDWLQELTHFGRHVAAVSVHEDQDVSGRRQPLRPHTPGHSHAADAATTRAPAACASAAVASVLPLSTTMHSRISSHGISLTNAAIFSASFRAGMTTETAAKSEAPAQAAIGTGRGRLRAQQRAAKLLVFFAIPDFAHGLLGGVAQGKAVVAAHRKRSNATGKRLAVRGDVHQAPGTAAQRPWAVVLALLDAHLRLGRTRRTEEHAEFPGDGLGSLDNFFFLLRGVFKQCRLRPRQSLPLGEIHHSLQIDLHDAQAMGQANEGLQLRQRLPQTGKPEGNTRRLRDCCCAAWR